MPYYFLFDDLPAERPVGPLPGFYEPAEAELPIADDAGSSKPTRVFAAFFPRLTRSDWSTTSETAITDIGRILRAGFARLLLESCISPAAATLVVPIVTHGVEDTIDVVLLSLGHFPGT